MTSEDLRSMGYVRGNLEPLGSSPAEGGGIEFYFAAWGDGDEEHTSFVAEPWMLENEGWVRRPTCGDCEGGMKWTRPDPAYPMAEPMGRTCPSCGGSGFGKAIGQ